MANVTGMGAAWMRKEDWPRWLEIDPDLQPDYTHWLQRMEAAVAQLQANGTPTIKVVIDPDEFMAWAKANGKGVGTGERATYAAMKALQSDQSGNRG